MYPVNLAAATPESVETIFARFLELQSVWASRLAGLVADEQDDDEDVGKKGLSRLTRQDIPVTFCRIACIQEE